MGEHGVADTYTVKKGAGSERRCELVSVTEESFVLCDTFITSHCFSLQIRYKSTSSFTSTLVSAFSRPVGSESND